MQFKIGGYVLPLREELRRFDRAFGPGAGECISEVPGEGAVIFREIFKYHEIAVGRSVNSK